LMWSIVGRPEAKSIKLGETGVGETVDRLPEEPADDADKLGQERGYLQELLRGEPVHLEVVIAAKKEVIYPARVRLARICYGKQMLLFLPFP